MPFPAPEINPSAGPFFSLEATSAASKARAGRLRRSRGALCRTLHVARDLIRARPEGQGQKHTIAMAG